MAEVMEKHEKMDIPASAASAVPPLIPASWGEVIDKITILEIKRRELSNEAALRNV